MALLVPVCTGSGKLVALDTGSNIIGRSTAVTGVKDPAVSRTQLNLFVEWPVVVATVLGTNHTTVTRGDGTRHKVLSKTSVRLNDGDVIWLGKVGFRVNEPATQATNIDDGESVSTTADVGDEEGSVVSAAASARENMEKLVATPVKKEPAETQRTCLARRTGRRWTGFVDILVRGNRSVVAKSTSSRLPKLWEKKQHASAREASCYTDGIVAKQMKNGFNFEDPRWKLPPDVVAFLDAHGEDRDSETKTPSSTPPLAPGRRKVTVGADGWETWQDGTDGSDDEDMPKDELKGIPAAPAPTRTNRKRARSRDSSASTAHATAVVAPRATSDGSVDQAFAGHCFCLTGTLSMVRDQWQEEIRNHGGTTAKTVTRNVTELVASDTDGKYTSKHQKAERLGIPIVTEQFLWDLLEKAKKQRMSAAAATTSPQRAKKRRRQACRYGAQCYNHGKEHRAKYAHVDSVEDTCEGEGGEEQEGKDVTAVDTTAACQVDFAAADDDGSKMEEPDASAASDSDTGSTEAHLDLRDGESRTVEGGSDTYVVKNVSGVYSCTCAAWKFQSKPIDRRTCRHILEIRGEAAESQRLKREVQQIARLRPKGGMPGVLLAHKYTEGNDVVRAYWNGTDFFSRNGNLFYAPEWYKEGMPKDHCLDGELWVGRRQFSAAISIARSSAGAHWKKLQYRVFDVPSHTGVFEERIAAMARICADCPDHVTMVEQRRCPSQEALDKEMNRIIALGGEGLMLRKPKSTYERRRSRSLLKVKRFYDAEAKVIGYKPGKGKHTGKMGALKVELPNGKFFFVGGGFSDAQREDPPAIGSIITYKYQEMSSAGIPRFPTFLRVRQGAPWPPPS